MTATDHIKAAQKSKSLDKDGKEISLAFSPPSTTEEIDDLQARVGQQLPEELRALLTFCSGIEGCCRN